jgi:hypothetical protein
MDRKKIFFYLIVSSGAWTIEIDQEFLFAKKIKLGLPPDRFSPGETGFEKCKNRINYIVLMGSPVFEWQP